MRERGGGGGDAEELIPRTRRCEIADRGKRTSAILLRQGRGRERDLIPPSIFPSPSLLVGRVTPPNGARFRRRRVSICRYTPGAAECSRTPGLLCTPWVASCSHPRNRKRRTSEAVGWYPVVVGGKQREEKREKGRRDGVPAKVAHGRVPPRIRFRVPVALMTAILPLLALVLPFPTITPLPSSHHRESHPPLRGAAPCPPLSRSLSPSLSQPSTQYTSRMTRITSQRRERATCSPLSPSLSLSLSLPPSLPPILRKVPIVVPPRIRLPRDSLPAPRRGTPCTYTRYM